MPHRCISKVYEIYEKYYFNKEHSDLFDITIVKLKKPVNTSLISLDFLKAEKKDFDHCIANYLKQNFYTEGNVFPKRILINQGN